MNTQEINELSKLLGQLHKIEAELDRIISGAEREKPARKAREPRGTAAEWNPGKDALEWIKSNWGDTPCLEELDNFRDYFQRGGKRKTVAQWDAMLKTNPVFINAMNRKHKKPAANSGADVVLVARNLHTRIKYGDITSVTDLDPSERQAFHWLVDNGYAEVSGGKVRIKEGVN